MTGGDVPLPHGYTNRTVGAGDLVRKSYVGTGAADRMRRERVALTRVAGALPVPAVHGVDGDSLVLERMPGVHGQDLVAAGHAAPVLAGCGRVLARIHAVDATGWFGDGGSTLVHGDFGPNNALLDPGTFDVTAVLDWEWAHAGDPVDDLAWCEWVVRMHHPDAVEQLGAFFTSYALPVPSWRTRHDAMVGRCEELRAMCRSADPGGAGDRLWAYRTEITAGWRE